MNIKWLQVVAPDIPYVAAAGRNQLYFIDTRFDPETAKYAKEQIERATIPWPDKFIKIDKILATAKVVNRNIGETTFVFDPPYPRAFFAKGINKRNPEIKLPEHEPAGNWVVSYDLGTSLTKRRTCASHGCNEGDDSSWQTNGDYDTCKKYKVDKVNVTGGCHIICSKAVDTPREDGETDDSYYQWMDKLHWS